MSYQMFQPVPYGPAPYGQPMGPFMMQAPSMPVSMPVQTHAQRSEIEDLRRMNAELDKENDYLRQENDDLRQKHLTALEKLAGAQDKLINSASTTVAVAQIADLESQLKKLIEERDEARTKAVAFGNGVAKLRDVLEKTKQELTISQQRVVSLEQEVASAIALAEEAKSAMQQALQETVEDEAEEDADEEVEEKPEEDGDDEAEEKPATSWFEEEIEKKPATIATIVVDEGVASTTTTVCTTPFLTETKKSDWASIAKSAVMIPDPEPLQKPFWKGTIKKAKKSQEKQIESKFATIHVPSAYDGKPLDQLSTDELLRLVKLVYGEEGKTKKQQQYLKNVSKMLDDMLQAEEGRHDLVEVFRPSKDSYGKTIDEINISTLVWYIKDAVYGWLGKSKSYVTDDFADEARDFFNNKSNEVDNHDALKTRLFA